MNKLAIVCGAPSSEMLAPFDDPEYDIWVLGNRSNRYSRFDLIFEIHDDLTEHGDVDKYVNYLLSLEKPMVVGEKFPAEGPDITVYPFDAVKEMYGSTYLTSSPAYMIGYALLMGHQHIEIYGADMAVDDHEYFWQRPGVEAWVGFAKGRGVNVVIPPESPLGRSEYVEGRGSGGKPDFAKPPFTESAFGRMQEQHDKKVAESKEQRAFLDRVIDKHEAASEVYKKLAQVARGVEAGIEFDKLEDGFRVR